MMQEITCSAYHKNDDQILNPVPSCFLSHLKSISIISFEGSDGELHVLHILLKNTPVLESMVIHWVKNVEGYSHKEEEVHDELLALQRESTSCKINISFFGFW